MTINKAEITLQDQIQNWNNFCQHHLGDWHGIWTRYSADGEATESFKCVRTFQLSEDGDTVYHRNDYTYTDGRTESKTFGPYKKPITTPLFLNNSFSWGSIAVTSSPFGFEIGFRRKDRGASAAVMYDSNGNLQRITISPEQLGSFTDKLSAPLDDALQGNWEGVLETMTPNLKILNSELSTWKKIEDIGELQHTFHFPGGVSVSCPKEVEKGKEMLLVVDYLVEPTLLQRGIRHFNNSGLEIFTLESFTVG